MAINIPFNFQPVSVSVKTSSYTIPASNYAFITANVRNGGSFTIDSSTVLQSSSAVDGAVSEVSQTISSVSTYTVPSGYRFEGHASNVSGGAGATILVNGDQVAVLGVDETTTVKAGAGAVISTSIGGDSDLTGFSLRENEPESNVTASFWVPSGTILNGTGTWRVTVSLYNEIS